MRYFPFALLILAAGSLLAADNGTPKPEQQTDDKTAVAELEKLGAQIEKDDRGAVKRLAFGYSKATDATLVYLQGLHNLESLNMPCIAKVTDKGLANLEGLSELRFLYIGYSSITDQGLTHLKGLKNLEKLGFSHGKADITDAGLEHLKGLNHLSELRLGAAKVTDAGVKTLQQALPKCKIEWKPPTKDERQGRAAPDQPSG